jgi:transposase
LKASYEDLLLSVQSEDAVHMDETGWKVAFNDAHSGNFAWVMTPVNSTDVVYAFGKSRGGGNINPLLGDFKGIGITDGYTAYMSVFEQGKHALCWAHPDRKIRDLKNSESLSEEKKKHCLKVSGRFSELYAEVRRISVSEFIEEERIKAREILIEKFKLITAPNKNDPSKLAAIKKSLLKQVDCYFVCVTTENIPTDNNKAERALRHLTIKRKKSFGSKTPKGAAIMSVLYSVVMSLWYRSKENFFTLYNESLSF